MCVQGARPARLSHLLLHQCRLCQCSALPAFLDEERRTQELLASHAWTGAPSTVLSTHSGWLGKMQPVFWPVQQLAAVPVAVADHPVKNGLLIALSRAASFWEIAEQVVSKSD